MKTRKLILGITLTLALTLIVLLNQQNIAAQGSTPTPPYCLTSETTAGAHINIDQVSMQSCGTSTIFNFHEGWKKEDGIAAKFDQEEVTISSS